MKNRIEEFTISDTVNYSNLGSVTTQSRKIASSNGIKSRDRINWFLAKSEKPVFPIDDAETAGPAYVGKMNLLPPHTR